MDHHVADIVALVAIIAKWQILIVDRAAHLYRKLKQNCHVGIKMMY